MAELSIIQKTYDLIKWYVPILNRLPRDHRLFLGHRIVNGLYELLEGLVVARYSKEPEKLTRLRTLNGKLSLLRYQTRLLLDFELISARRYQYAGQFIHAIGTELGGWIRQQQQPQERP